MYSLEDKKKRKENQTSEPNPYNIEYKAYAANYKPRFTFIPLQFTTKSLLFLQK